MAKQWKDLMATMPPARRVRVAKLTQELKGEMPLQELRRARQHTQETLAEALNVGQAEVSKIERRTDLYVSTLRRYIEARGGALDIVARFPDGSVRITQFEDAA